MPRPDFFIVGAPKCGTTALHHYLGRHPSIHMARKELHFFGSDLAFAPHRRRLTQAEYLAHFRRAPASADRVGEASVWYLYSTRAPQEIKSFSPAARIIIMLRNPVDMLYSLHGQLVYGGDETIEDFQSALAAESDRRRGFGIPAKTLYPPGLFYREAGRYVDGVEEYLCVFGRENVHIIIFDDLKADPHAVYANTLRFLDVDDRFAPSFPVVNGSKRARNRILQDIVTGRTVPFVSRWAKEFLPARVRNRGSDCVMRLNARRTRRQPMDSDLRQQLRREFAPEVERLGELLGRDLKAWSGQPQQSGHSAHPAVH